LRRVILASILFFAVALGLLVVPNQIKMRELTSTSTSYLTHRDPETSRVAPLEVILRTEMRGDWDKYPRTLIMEAFRRLNPKVKLPLKENMRILIPHPSHRKASAQAGALFLHFKKL